MPTKRRFSLSNLPMASSPHRHPSLYSPLIDTFDAIGWVPTVRGELWLGVFGKSVMGDVDNYYAQFKIWDPDFHSSRYLAATSLYTFKDNIKSTSGLKWHTRTFRYIFHGTINDKEKSKAFVKKYNFERETEEDKIQKLFLDSDSNVLIGTLSIVPQIKRRELPKKEVGLLSNMAALHNKYDEYRKRDGRNEGDLNGINDAGTELKRLWGNVESSIKEFESSDMPHFSFDVVLSQDGLLFLKDASLEKFQKVYFQKNTPSDYTKNVPLHRIFKIAQHYISSLFHTNYHHPDGQDSFLPVSNLHPIKADRDTEKLVEHQINAFLCPVVSVKRSLYVWWKNILCDPNGVLAYLNSFIEISVKNKFIKPDVADVYRHSVKTLGEEYKIWAEEHKTVLGSFLAQKSILTSVLFSTGLLAVIVNVYKFLYPCGVSCDPKKDISFNWQIVIVCSVSLFILHRFYVLWKIYKGRFGRKGIWYYIKSILKWIFIRNSKDDRLSRLYCLYIDLTNFSAQLTKTWWVYVLFGFGFVVIFFFMGFLGALVFDSYLRISI